MRRRPWHYATSYGPGRRGPDFCLWCNVETCHAHDLCPCCRSRWVRFKRRMTLTFAVPAVRSWRWLAERGDAA